MSHDISGPLAGPPASEHTGVADQDAAIAAGADQPPAAAGALPAAAATAEGAQPPPEPGKPRKAGCLR